MKRGRQPESGARDTGNAPKRQKRSKGSPSRGKSKGAPRKAVDPEKVARHSRGHSVVRNRIKDKKLKGSMRRLERKVESATDSAARAELLLPEEQGTLEAEGMEKTFRFAQSDIQDAVDVASANKLFRLDLPTHGPYVTSYSNDGRHILLAGRRGHLSMIDCHTMELATEVFSGEAAYDASFLHNSSLFAVAQHRYTYIYDNHGSEIHCLRDHEEPRALQFLPYHMLLGTVGTHGWLKYRDTSTGALVSEHRTRLGPCNVMRQNPHNAVIGLGHSNGTVTYWTPNMPEPVVKLLCHRGPVRAMAFDGSGRYMVTSGNDAKLRVFDTRTMRLLHDYFTPRPGHSVDVSQTGLIGVGNGPHVQVWKDAFATKADAPYLRHTIPGHEVECVRFRPYEDQLGIGFDAGLQTCLVPGAGVANYDSLEADPFQSKKGRREAEVHRLLDKIPAELISMDPTSVARLSKTPLEIKAEEDAERRKANTAAAAREAGVSAKKKSRGRSRARRREAKKQENVITRERELRKEKAKPSS